MGFLALVAAALVAAAPGVAVAKNPSVDCTLSQPQACRNTNLLAWDPAFVRAVRKFLGRTRVNYLYVGRLDDQQLDAIGGPPDPPVRIGELYRFTACRHHYCPEKGAVVLEPRGLIVATAVLHSACVEPPKNHVCVDKQVLSVFVRDPSGAKVVVDNLAAWASAEVAAGYDPDNEKPRLAGVEVFSVATGTPKRVMLD